MPALSAANSLSAVILAGGAGARFDGADKGLLTLLGKPLIEHALQALAPQANHILISANRNIDLYARYGHPVVRDTGAGFAGPLAGISAALNQACTEWVLFAPVDAACLPADYARKMCSAVHQNGSNAAVVHDGISIVPVACLLHRSLLNDLNATLTSNRRSVRDWLRTHCAVEVHFDHHPRAYWSVNTPVELQALERLIKNNGNT